MNSRCDAGEGGPLSEIAIVDTFTKLVFGEEDGFSPSEELIIMAFRLVDTSVVFDIRKDMVQYLRDLGVTEMIQLVARVQACLADGLQALIRASAEPVPDRKKYAR